MFLFVFLLGTLASHAESLEGPFIWITGDKRGDLLETIENEACAASYLTQFKMRVDAEVNKHRISPALTLPKIPEFATDPNQYNDRDFT